MPRRKSLLNILLGRPRYKSKCFFGMLIEGQERTEKRNTPGSHRSYKRRSKNKWLDW